MFLRLRMYSIFLLALRLILKNSYIMSHTIAVTASLRVWEEGYQCFRECPCHPSSRDFAPNFTTSWARFSPEAVRHKPTFPEMSGNYRQGRKIRQPPESSLRYKFLSPRPSRTQCSPTEPCIQMIFLYLGYCLPKVADMFSQSFF